MNLGYTIPARVYPVVIVCLPVAFAMLSWFPDEKWSLGLSSAAVVTGALAMLSSQLGRDLGKAKEPGLWESWGGKPTTQLLRHRDRFLDSNTKRRYHDRLSELMGTPLPTAEQEAAHPAAADDAYDACVKWLIAKTRVSGASALLFKENVNYGFRRNLWGMRPAGLLISALGLVAAMAPQLVYIKDGLRVNSCISIVANAVLFVLWCFRFTSEWIRLPAFRYAEELLLTIEVLPST
jgi:hypothetical protein